MMRVMMISVMTIKSIILKTYVSTSRGSAMNRVTKNGIMAKTSTMFIPSWANKDNFCFAVTHWSTEYTLNIILSDASASKSAFLVVKVFEIVFRCRRNPPFVPRLIKVSLNSRQNLFTF